MQQVFRKSLQMLLLESGFVLNDNRIERLHGDGSDRQFFRLWISGPTEKTLIAVFPAEAKDKFLSEAASSVAIARHLSAFGVPVPSLIGYDRYSGLLICEDVGDFHLSDYLHEVAASEGHVEKMYRQVIDDLLRMQTAAAKGFSLDMCYDSFVYDKKTMIEREGLYFIKAFGLSLLNLPIDADGVLQEFDRLADRIMKICQGEMDYLLHRDFQSRNIMVQDDGSVRFLDFQAARKGPLAYDLASLLIDPYAALSKNMQDRLFSYYGEKLKQIRPSSLSAMVESYPLLALQRNMQILGAFAFLSHQKKKTFFSAYIPLAFQNLSIRLEEPWAHEFVALKSIAYAMGRKMNL
jgi:aminoglycoside/choline kinase family phosphotransferase